MPNANALIVRTSVPGWMTQVARAYKAKNSFELVDDAGMGVDPLNQTLLDMGRKANLTVPEWIGVLISLGMSATGAGLLVMAIVDPEPFSKISFAIGSGVLLVAGGGFSAIRILTGHKPPRIKVLPSGAFEINFG